jgi:hypothetical protein
MWAVILLAATAWAGTVSLLPSLPQVRFTTSLQRLGEMFLKEQAPVLAYEQPPPAPIESASYGLL